MSKSIYPKVIDRREAILTGWQENAPDATFAELSLEQFEQATLKSISVRKRIEAAKAVLSALNQERMQVDEETQNTQKLVINAVRGNPQYGENSPLYRSMGLVPANRRKSGLIRRGSVTTGANAA